MGLTRALVIALGVLSLLAGLTAAQSFGVINVEHKKTLDCEWSIELGDELFYYTKHSSHIHKFSHVDPNNIYIIPRIHKDEALAMNGTLLYHAWGFAIFSPANEDVVGSRGFKFNGKSMSLVRMMPSASMYSPWAIHVPGDADLPPISELVAKISGPSWFQDVTTLAGYNRYSLGTGLASAQDWVISQLKLLPNLTVTTEPFTVSGRQSYNVIATLPGTTLPNEWVIIGAHLDSTSQSPTTSAPGAEDNGSGSAGLLQLVRALSVTPAPRTAIFIWFSGEEQGLVGSKFNVNGIVSRGDKAKLKHVHIMDMIGYRRTTTLSVLLETYSQFSSLFQTYTAARNTYAPTLGIATSTNAWGSDHEPYLAQGIPALLTIDSDWDSYPHYHRTTDLPQYLSQDIATAILRMNVATCAVALGYTQTF